MNQSKIEKELRIIKIYAACATVTCAVLFGIVFKAIKNEKFEEIDVERINIVEKDGKLRMVISNQLRQHPGTLDGITFDERKGQRPPGIMFFGENGNEVGGLVFDGDNSGGQGGSLTFDKFRGDQTIQFIHDENINGTCFAGLKMNDQNMPLNDLLNKQKEIANLPKEQQDSAWKKLRDQGLLMAERLRIGKDYDKSSILKMKDAKGKVRLELRVEADGNAKINFLDESEKVIYSLPADSKKRTKIEFKKES
ncbi:MAG: hypothetical protein IPM97_16100 [Bdellovibrionaceae bacterium]|nr:hypothetical protein [Pseudobdellovibrionaceae bacterium]